MEDALLRQLLAQHAEVSRRQQAACRMSRNHAAHGQALGAQAAAIAEQIQNRRDALNCEAAETKPALAARAPLVLKAADNERRFEFEERKKRKRPLLGAARLSLPVESAGGQVGCAKV